MTESKRRIGSDLAKVDAHVIQPEEYEDAPEWSEEDFDRAEMRVGGKLVRPGRPRSAVRKKAVSLRLSPDILEYFRADGPGWQTRIDEALREWARQHPRARP